MKANAPKKLYITNDEKRFSDKCHSASTEKYIDNDIEYTRTDTFIEKALGWMISQGGVNDALSKEMIDDFRKYMKGE